MREPFKNLFILVMVVMPAMLQSGCTDEVDNRIPAMPVSVEFSNSGMWNTYGVKAIGESNDFIIYKGTVVPMGFPYTQYSATGYGGVLLICGFDVLSSAPDTMTPLAYDLSCPVECSQTIRVEVSPSDFVAECPVCHSRYDVVYRCGAAISGPAVASKYDLKRYQVMQSGMGGYLITN